MGSLDAFREEARDWMETNCRDEWRRGTRDKITREGFMKSLTADPSLRNSGLEHTWNGVVVRLAMVSRTIFAVPTGTVLLVITIFVSFM